MSFRRALDAHACSKLTKRPCVILYAFEPAAPSGIIAEGEQTRKKPVRICGANNLTKQSTGLHKKTNSEPISPWHGALILLRGLFVPIYIWEVKNKLNY